MDPFITDAGPVVNAPATVSIDITWAVIEALRTDDTTVQHQVIGTAPTVNR